MPLYRVIVWPRDERPRVEFRAEHLSFVNDGSFGTPDSLGVPTDVDNAGFVNLAHVTAVKVFIEDNE